MFKVGEIKQVSNEEIVIKKTKHENGHFENGKVRYTEIESLNFKILSDDYSFEFSLKEPIDSLLDIPMNEKVDLKEKLFIGETFFNINDKENYIDPYFDITIYRYLDNKFEISIVFLSDELEKANYSGSIIFDFDLNNYLDK